MADDTRNDPAELQAADGPGSAPDEVDGRDLDAGDFSAWVTEMRGAIRGEHGSAVPCDGCTACCTSSQFVHITPDETDALAHIPPELVFPAPLAPPGHVLMGYDERGHCPMLVDGACSIYEHRPRTCRTYDCRVFPAAGVDLHDVDKVLIARRARRWRFRFPGPDDRTRHAAIRAATAFVREHADLLPSEAVPAATTQLAVLALEVHEAFLQRDEATARTTLIDPTPGAVAVEVTRSRPPREDR